MSAIKDGGPAFPVPGNTTSRPDLSEYGMAGHSGMTLRDWFAGIALPSAIDKFNHFHKHHAINMAVSKWSYEIADAMLSARKEESP